MNKKEEEGFFEVGVFGDDDEGFKVGVFVDDDEGFWY